MVAVAPQKPSWWGKRSDDVLRPLFAEGKTPTDKELKAAYPFGQRAMWPYKVWLEHVAWWKAGCPDKSSKGRRPTRPLPGQEAFL